MFKETVIFDLFAVKDISGEITDEILTSHEGGNDSFIRYYGEEDCLPKFTSWLKEFYPEYADEEFIILISW